MAISSLQAGKTLAQLSDWKLNPLQMQKILYLANLYHLGHFDEEKLTTFIEKAGQKK